MLPHLILRALVVVITAILSLPATKGRSSSNADQYEVCGAPQRCGSINISYPFYISGVQESYCGYPGFALNCSQEGLPTINFSGNDFLVGAIDYISNSITVFDAYSLSSVSEVYSCRKLLQNATVPASTFSYVGNNLTRLHLFSNCSSLSERIDLVSYAVPCNCSGEYNNSSMPQTQSMADGAIVAMYGTDENLKEAQDKCGMSGVRVVQRLGNFSSKTGNFNATETLGETLRSGIELSWTASDCGPCSDSGGTCGFDSTSYRFTCYCQDRPHSRSCTGRRRTVRLALVISLAGAAMGVFIFIFLILFVARKRNKRNRLALKNKNDMELFLKKNGGGVAPKRYRYSQLKKMTNKFRDSLGKGGYGTVYKGTSDDGRFVAVKVLDGTKGNGEEFLNEVACISRTSHVNIVSLLGFCLEGSKRALVYEYMPNGSLDKFLHDPSSSSSTEALAWEKMRGIALGIARGLEYLHQGCSIRILHFDIKPHNVLLDGDLRPKISDFGLAKLCPERASHVSMSGMRGTVGYIAPEVFSRNFGPVSYKSDVYSYGMMVLEMVGERTGKGRGGATSSAAYFPNWIYRNLEADFGGGGDGEISEDGDSRAVKRKLTIVGLWCIQNDPKERPSMAKVVEMLEGDAESLTVPPKPYLSSPAREVRKEAPVSSSSAVSSDFDVGN